MIKVLITDDQVLLRESLKGIIEMDAAIKVVGCAGNGFEAEKLCRELSPDVVLMDLKMPDCDGVEGTRLIKKANSSIKVVVLTTFEDEENVRRAIENGADGYILKDVLPEELLLVIKNAANGFFIMSPKTSGTVIRQINQDGNFGREAPNHHAARLLKESEFEILQLIAEGKSNKEIAIEVFLSEGRIKNIITGILEKLALKDRYQLLSFAYKNNLIHIEKK